MAAFDLNHHAASLSALRAYVTAHPSEAPASDDAWSAIRADVQLLSQLLRSGASGRRERDAVEGQVLPTAERQRVRVDTCVLLREALATSWIATFISHFFDLVTLSRLDSTCRAFHRRIHVPGKGLTQSIVEARAGKMLSPLDLAAFTRVHCPMVWSRWLAKACFREFLLSFRRRSWVSCGGGEPMIEVHDTPTQQHKLVLFPTRVKNGILVPALYAQGHGDGSDYDVHQQDTVGQLGLGDVTAARALTEVKTDSVIISVSCGASHSLALTQEGAVLSFGLGLGGRLGHGMCNQTNVRVPKMIRALQGIRVVQVSAGDRHSLVLTDSGDVFSFGCNTSGQLGLGDTEDRHEPTLVKTLAARDPETGNRKRVVQVSAAFWWTLMVLDNGHVYMCGRRGFAIRAADVKKHPEPRYFGSWKPELLLIPTLVETLLGKRVVQVSSGHHHGLALAADGDVLSFGGEECEEDGLPAELGHGDKEYYYWLDGKEDSTSLYWWYPESDPPRVIAALRGKDVIQVSAGPHHNLVLTGSGDVYSFGRASRDLEDLLHAKFGQGTPSSWSFSDPIRVEGLRGRRVIQVEAGANQSIVMTMRGPLVFGLVHYAEAAYREILPGAEHAQIQGWNDTPGLDDVAGRIFYHKTPAEARFARKDWKNRLFYKFAGEKKVNKVGYAVSLDRISKRAFRVSGTFYDDVCALDVQQDAVHQISPRFFGSESRQHFHRLLSATLMTRHRGDWRGVE